MPGLLKKPPRFGAAVLNPPLFGWVMLRLKGDAVFGAVAVLGGAENVRVPREPELPPPPMRASAGESASVNGNASVNTTAIVFTMPRMLNVNFMFIPSIPGRGKLL
jgi:hypothetical protein